MKNHGYQLTLKGWLAMRVINCKTLDDFSKLWDDLANEVKHTAINNGHEDGIPALILHGSGQAITVFAEDE